MPPWPAVDPSLRAEDLAPGDRVEASKDWRDVQVRRVRGTGDPDFGLAYQKLWNEFGARNEMETRAVIRDRLAWDPAQPRSAGRHGLAALAYELLVLRRRSE